MKLFLLAALLLQQQRTITGVIVSQSGEPVRGANVFVLETLEGTLSDSIGHFRLSLRTIPQNGGTLVIQRIGLRELRQALGSNSELRIVLQAEAVALPELSVVAGRFVTGSSPDAQLTTLQVVSTPGASADVYRALQTFPGLQSVDEGAGLFVRGGDVGETRVYLNDAVVLSPYRYESPTGGFFGAFDPFQLDGIYFSSGGFGARYGNALSGVAALESVGRPPTLAVGATASLAALSGTVSVPLGDDLGARATLTRSNTELMFKVNGTTTRFTHEPEGRDASVIAAWSYGQGELRLFAIDQWSQLGVFVTDPEFAGALNAYSNTDGQVLSWQHKLRSTRVTLVAAHAGARNDFDYGVFDITTRDRLNQVRGLVSAVLTPFLGLTVGAELDERTTGILGRTPASAHDKGAGAPAAEIRHSTDDRHSAAFSEIDWTLSDRARIIGGLRADGSRRSEQITVDPRVSLAYRASSSTTLTGAWGVYHQIADPDLHDFAFGGGNLDPMRAEHNILGVQMGDDKRMLRVEGYHKRYRGLAKFSRDRTVSRNGIGSSRGLDVFARWPEWQGISGRVSYSFINASRTDPNTGMLARSEFDITHSLTGVVERTFAQRWQVSGAYRYASGRPFTAIQSAQLDSQRRVWIPVYGSPNAERLPSFSRIDLSTSYLIPMPRQRLLVLFVAANNIFDRRNVHDYRYNADYSERTEVRSQFKRSVYFGASFTY